MSKREIKGLRGLKGFNSLSDAEYAQWKKENSRYLGKYSTYQQEEELYNTQRFVKSYGKEAAKKLSYSQRLAVEKHDIVQDAFFKEFNPYFNDDKNSVGPNGDLYDASKGLGADFEKYNAMTDEGKIQLLESGYLTNSELDANIKAKQKRAEDLYINSGFAGTEAGAAGFFSYSQSKDSQEKFDRERNAKIIEKIYNEDLKKRTSKLKPIEDQYYTENILKMSDDEVNAAFMKIAKPAEGGGPAYIFSAYFNDDGTSSEDETKNFSIDDKRHFLAKKVVYDHFLGPEAGYEALNNEAKEYLNDHQSWVTYTGLLAKDIAIGTASYTADKWNGVRKLTLLGQNATVYMTNDGQVVPTADVKNDGEHAFYEVNGQRIPVHQQTLSLMALDDMGKDENGEDRGWFNNAQFWTDAERFGTMDEEELAQYKKLGFSPYKVVYKPGDETDLWYEALKTTSFALADMGANFIPVGTATLGTNMIAKAAQITGAMSKAMQVTGKTLAYTGKIGQKAAPILSAVGMGNTTSRGLFGETFTGNLQQLEQSVVEQANKEIHNLYTNDEEYRAQFDQEVEQEYQQLLAEHKKQAGRQSTGEGVMINFDLSNNPEFLEGLKSQAKMSVINRKTSEWIDNFKNSEKYGDALQEAAESASDAAFTSSLITAAKSTIANYNWRRYLFKTPAELAASYNKKAIEGIEEVTNSAGKKRLTSKFDFSTIVGKSKELSKIAGAQIFENAFDEVADETIIGGSREINDDRMSQYIQGLYGGKARETRYAVLEGLASYFQGSMATLGSEDTWRAGIVGGLSSVTNFTPNLSSLIATKDFKQTWKNASFGEKANMLLANGILNEYYAKKQGQVQLRNTVNLVNKILDENNDFEAIDRAIALDMATIDATNPADANALSFLKAVQAIDMLNAFKEDKEIARVGQESTVMQKAMTAIEKLSDPSKLTEEETADYLSQYYASNPSVAQSEDQDKIALQELQQRAIKLQEASEVYADIENTLGQIEKSRGTRLPNQVRARLVHRLTLDKFLTDRTAELEEKITGVSTPSTSESSLASYGSKQYQESHVRSTEAIIKKVEREISKADKEYDEANKNMADYNSTPQDDPGFTRKENLQKAIDNARIQLEHLNNIKSGLTLQLERFSEQVPKVWDSEFNVIETRTSAKVTDQVISADEILRLNPQDRARMLDKANYNKYSDAQKIEIDKLRNELMVKDPALLYNIQEQADLTQRINANRRAYATMLENPEAAAYQFESDEARQALQAKANHLDRVVTTIAEGLKKVVEQSRAKGEDIETIEKAIYKNLRVLNKDILEYMHDSYDLGIELSTIYREIKDAKEWSDMVTDMSSIIDTMGMEEGQKNAFTKNLDTILDNTRTKAEVLDELGKVVESSSVEASAKIPFEQLLSGLEQLWNQRASTTSMTREERQAAQEEYKKKAVEEAKRKQEAEEAARAEAEKKAAEAAAAGITEDDTDTSNDKDAELAANGLTDKDLTTDNESTLTPEQIAQGVAEGEDVNLDSPTLEEQVAAEPDKVDIRPAPKNDASDQGNNLPSSGTNLLGNSMYGYDLDPLKHHGKQVPRKGKNIYGVPDKMSKYFQWMESAGIKLQDIIDEELREIIELDPDVYPLFVKFERNATNDDAMSDFPLLVVEYTSDIASIHNDKNGGVLTSGGKQYLVIGTLGFPTGTGKGAQGSMFRDVLNKSPRKPFFDANPSERFFVNKNMHTKIHGLTAGRLVRQLTTDSEVQIRTISELLSDEARNPKGLTMGDLKWGIQYDNKLAVVNVSDRNTVYPPSDGASNLGSVFLLVEAANGNYIPAYIRPVRFTELREGKLKTQLEDLFKELASSDYTKRYEAIKQLVQLLNLSQSGDNILIGTKDKPTVSIVKEGEIRRTFNLANPNENIFGQNGLIETLKGADFRVNITTSTLSDVTSLEMFDEAGALTTDLAKLETSGASYNVYGIDAEGNPIITAPIENQAPTLEAGSDLAKAQKKLDSEQMGNVIYRKNENGNWITDTDQLVTDPILIEQLNYKNLIRTKDLKPDKTIGMDEIFVINRDTNNPHVLVRRRGTQIFAMSKKGAIKTIIEINAELIEKAIQERLKKELEIEASNDEAIRNMSEEDKQRAIEGADSVDLGLEETLTEKQIAEQMLGNFEEEATPQQKTAEELVERIFADTADIQLSEDGSTYIDSNGKHYARVTSIIAADEFSDGRFEADNPWGLPSTTIGTGIDEFVRDFFANKLGNMDNLADRYPNASNEQLQAFAKQLEKLREDFNRRGLTIIPRDVTVTGTVEVKTKSGDKKVIDVAGTLDLLAYDKNGNFYIFDMKTNRSVPKGESGRKKGAKWSKQLSLYKQLLQEKYGAVVKELSVIPIQVDYPAPKGWGNATTEYTKKGNQLYADGKEYRMAEPVLHDIIPLPETSLSIDYSKLTPVEQAMVRTVADVAPTKDKEAPVVQPEPVKTGEDINKTGTKSLAELQSKKKVDTASAIINSREFGRRARNLLRTKFPDMPKKSAELEGFLQSKGIATTGITDVEQWLKMIEECK